MTITDRKQLPGVTAVFLIGLLAACATLPQPDTRTSHIGPSAAGLGELTIQLHEDMLLRHKMDRFAAIASDKYIVMIPGGITETKQENIKGAKNFNVQSVKFSNVAVHLHGISAVVTGRWSLVGHLGKLEMSGDYEFMSFYENLEGKWILVSESITRRQTLMKAALSG